jgi:hypothetical protein
MRVEGGARGNGLCIKGTKITLILALVLSFVTLLILSVVPNSPLKAAIFTAVAYIQALPTWLSMIILIEVG